LNRSEGLTDKEVEEKGREFGENEVQKRRFHHLPFFLAANTPRHLFIFQVVTLFTPPLPGETIDAISFYYCFIAIEWF